MGHFLKLSLLLSDNSAFYSKTVLCDKMMVSITCSGHSETNFKKEKKNPPNFTSERNYEKYVVQYVHFTDYETAHFSL